MTRLQHSGRTALAILPAVVLTLFFHPDLARATVLEDPSGKISAAPSGSNFTYSMTLKDASDATQPIGTFWFAWIPGQDYLATSPISETSPAGWTVDQLTHTGTGDGYAIRWVANSAASDIPIGGSLSGFGFTTTDSPASVDGNSQFYSHPPVLTSFVYNAGPFSDSGTEFVVTPAAAVPEPATLAIGLLPTMMLLRRKREPV